WTEALEWGFKKVRVLDVMLLHENTLDSPKKIDLVCVEVVLLNHESLERLLYLLFWIRELVKAEYLLDELDERTSVLLVYFLEILLGDEEFGAVERFLELVKVGLGKGFVALYLLDCRMLVRQLLDFPFD